MNGMGLYQLVQTLQLDLYVCRLVHECLIISANGEDFYLSVGGRTDCIKSL